MNLGLKNKMAFQGTVVSNAFIDTYMTAANGEYVKVFLYLLRHEGEEVTVSAIADALDHTEADVKRALAYWEEAGLSGAGRETEAVRSPARARKRKRRRPGMWRSPRRETAATVWSAFPGMRSLQPFYTRSSSIWAETFTQIECEKFAFFYDGLKMSGDLLEYLAEVLCRRRPFQHPVY